MKLLRSQVSRSEKVGPLSMVQASLQLPRGYLSLLEQYWREFVSIHSVCVRSDRP